MHSVALKQIAASNNLQTIIRDQKVVKLVFFGENMYVEHFFFHFRVYKHFSQPQRNGVYLFTLTEFFIFSRLLLLAMESERMDSKDCQKLTRRIKRFKTFTQCFISFKAFILTHIIYIN